MSLDSASTGVADDGEPDIMTTAQDRPGARSLWLRARALIDRAGSLETIAGTALTLGSVAVGAVLAYLMFTVAARQMGPEEFGRFATWFQIVTLLSAVASMGQETLILRSWSEYLHAGRPGLAMAALHHGVVKVLAGSAAVTIGIIAVGTFSGGASLSVLLAASLAMAGLALMSFTYAASRIISGILISVTNAEVTPRLVALLFLLAAPWLGAPVSTATALTAFGVGLAILIATQSFFVFRAIPDHVRQSEPEEGESEWRGRSFKMWMAGLLNTLVQTLDVVLLGLLIDPVLAGAYFAASRLANVMAKVTDGINVYATRKIAHLYFGGSLDELRGVLRSLAGMTGLLVAAAGLVLVLFGGALLSMFGESFVDQVPTLLVLVLGTGCAALGGPSRYLLLQTGHEAVCLWTTVAALVARVVLLIALAPVFGALGAAVAWTLTETATVVALNVACRKLVGADPSILNLVRPARDLPR